MEKKSKTMEIWLESRKMVEWSKSIENNQKKNLNQLQTM